MAHNTDPDILFGSDLDNFDENDDVATGNGEQQQSKKPLIELQMKPLSEEEKREARAHYGKVFDKVVNIGAAKENFDTFVNRLDNNLSEQNECLKTHGINELVTFDAKCFAKTAELSVDLAKKVNVESRFNLHEFARRVKSRALRFSSLSGSPSNSSPKWLRLEKLNTLGLAYSHMQQQVSIPMHTFRVPTNSVIKPVKRERKRAPRAKLTQATQATQFDITKGNMDESEKRLKYIHTTLQKLQLRNKDGVPMLQAALNPNSFASTVENFFNIAFLARQNMVKISAGDDEFGEPVVQTIEKNDDEVQQMELDSDEITVEDNNSQQVKVPNTTNKTTDSLKDLQSVLTIDYETVRLMCQNLGVTRSAFKP